MFQGQFDPISLLILLQMYSSVEIIPMLDPFICYLWCIWEHCALREITEHSVISIVRSYLQILRVFISQITLILFYSHFLDSIQKYTIKSNLPTFCLFCFPRSNNNRCTTALVLLIKELQKLCISTLIVVQYTWCILAKQLCNTCRIQHFLWKFSSQENDLYMFYV
jgi:hypothetical protein